MGELLEKYVEMSEGKQKSAVEPTKVVETVREPVGPHKRIVISEDAEPAVAPKSQGTKRKRYALTSNASSLGHLLVVVTKWIMATKKTVSSLRVKYPTPKSVPKPLQQTLAKSPTHPLCSLPNQPTLALFLNHRFALSSVHHRNPIYPGPSRR